MPVTPNFIERMVLLKLNQGPGPEVIAKVKLPVTAHRLLDVGGSHGLHAINFCKRYSDLSATILDGPQTQKLAEANIRSGG
jgi:hypothetical protein